MFKERNQKLLKKMKIWRLVLRKNPGLELSLRELKTTWVFFRSNCHGSIAQCGKSILKGFVCILPSKIGLILPNEVFSDWLKKYMLLINVVLLI